MARTRFTGTSGEVATGTSKKHILSVTAGSGRRTIVDKLAISFEGTTSSAAPVKVQVCRTTSSPYGGTTVTLVKKYSHQAESLVTTSKKAYTDSLTENVLFERFVHPQGGSLDLIEAYGSVFELAGSESLVVSVTSAAEVDCIVTMEGEE